MIKVRQFLLFLQVVLALIVMNATQDFENVLGKNGMVLSKSYNSASRMLRGIFKFVQLETSYCHFNTLLQPAKYYVRIVIQA